MIWVGTCFRFRVMVEFLRIQGLGLGSRLQFPAQGLGSRLSRL